MIRFGIFVLPQAGPYAQLAERWRRAEAMGFDGIWVADETPMQYPTVIGHEAWTLLGALARETSRVTIGPLVTPITFRHPLLLAMAASTVDHLSNGRLSLGLGAGGAPNDEAGVGVAWSPHERVARLEDQVAIVDALLRGATVTRIEGPYRMSNARVELPVQRPRPPLVIAAQGPRGIRLAATHADVWNSLAGQPAESRIPMDAALANTRRHVALLEEACREAGRDVASVRRSVLIWNFDAYGSIDALADYVGRYREAGIDEFVLIWPRATKERSAVEREATLERVASEMLPRLRRGT